MAEYMELAVSICRLIMSVGEEEREEKRHIDLIGFIKSNEELLKYYAVQGQERHRFQVEQRGAPVWINARPTEVFLALKNLIKNAGEAISPITGGAITVETGKRKVEAENGGLQSGSYVELSVSDTGAGMDEETQRGFLVLVSAPRVKMARGWA